MVNDSSTVKRRVTYRLADPLTLDECGRFGVRSPGEFTDGPSRDTIRAIWSEERRAPKKGEWYLSGAIVEAYRAFSDLTLEYHIARLVRVETKTIEVICELEDR